MTESTQRQKNELKVKVEQLLAAGHIYEAEKLYKKTPLFHISIYESLTAQYVSKYERYLWSVLENIFSQFDFIEAEYVFAQNQDVLDYRKYQDLKNKYLGERLKVQLSNLFKHEKFTESNELYLSQENLLNRDEYESIKAKYNHRMLAAILPELTSCFENNDYQSAENIYLKNETVFADGFYEAKKRTYLKKQLLEDLQELFRLRKFEEADALYLSNNDLIKTDEYAKQLLAAIEGLLCEARFIESDQFFAQHRDYITADSYEILRAKYIKNNLRLIEKNLNTEQSTAISKITKNNLVVARAGSGKTTTIACKALHLIKYENVSPEQILLVAFNRKAKEEIIERLRKKYNLSSMPIILTFHGLAYGVAQPWQVILYDDDKGIQKRQSQFVQQIIRETWDDTFKKDLYLYFRKEVSEIEGQDMGLSGADYLVYRLNQTHSTLGGDQVKSTGEKYIADFLFEHNISYQYEKNISWNGRRYRPDFSIDVFTNRKVILEHWGINEDDPRREVPPYWTGSWEDYRSQMRDKREFAKQQGIILLETSVVDMRKGRESFEEILKAKLNSIGVRCHKLPQDELIRRIVETQIVKITTLFLEFIQKAKKNIMTPQQIRQILSEATLDTRTYTFIKLATIIYDKYEKKLKHTNQIDFDDLISLATDKINKDGFKSVVRIKHSEYPLAKLHNLLVDEFQDFSKLFNNLVTALKTVAPDLKMLCVGDDWQAINGFAGSDLEYFTNYSRWFEDAGIATLTTNYRCGERIMQLGNRLMKNHGEASRCCDNNVGQGRIHLKNILDTRIEVREAYDEEKVRDEKYLFRSSSGKIFDDGFIKARYVKLCCGIIAGNPGKKIMIVSRTNQVLTVDLGFFQNKIKQCLREMGSQVSDTDLFVRTIHDSKGTEADVVIILQVCRGYFPLIHSDGDLYSIFGQTKDKILMEERRLFYVAITRAKEKLYFITEAGKEADFLKEVGLCPP